MRYPELAPFFRNPDHMDVKVVEGDVSLREFAASMIGYQPGWMTFLYHVRGVFVRFLGMKQDGVPKPMRVQPEDLPLTPGSAVAFFTTRASKEDTYWFGDVGDKHLNATLGVVVEPLANGLRRFHVITLVHYRHWTGPVYFNVIRPFHHLVVGQMARAGVA